MQTIIDLIYTKEAFAAIYVLLVIIFGWMFKKVYFGGAKNAINR